MSCSALRIVVAAVLLAGLVACSTTAVGPALSIPDDEPETTYFPAQDLDTDGDGVDEAVEALEEEAGRERRNPWHRLTFSVGAILGAQFDTGIRVDSDKYGVGTELSFEDILGLDDDASSLRLDLQYRFNRAHMIGLSWFKFDRKGDVRIDEDLEIGDEIFPAGAEVKTELVTGIYRFNYWWNFIAKRDWEVGVGLGVYWMRIKAGFAGRVTAGAVEFDESVEETVRVNFPPPLLGLRGAWAITPRLRLTGSAEVLYVPIDIFEGWIIDARLGLEWDIFDFMGLGLGYNFFNMGVEADLSPFTGSFDYRYHALVGSLYFYF